MGLRPPPESVKSLVFRGFWAATGAKPHFLGRKQFKPPPLCSRQIPGWQPI